MKKKGMIKDQDARHVKHRAASWIAEMRQIWHSMKGKCVDEKCGEEAEGEKMWAIVMIVQT